MPARTPALDPTIFVLYGATGDLAHRMVLPAFFTLFQNKLLPAQWRLIGNGRGHVEHEDFRASVRSSLAEFGPKHSAAEFSRFARQLFFAGGDFSSDAPGTLRGTVASAKKDLGPATQLVHYLAIPPLTFADLTKGLGSSELTENAKVVYEKPFGTSASTFRSLDKTVHRYLTEDQVYRIDHFLGKEATQDMHVLRFANELFGGMWDRKHVRAVQIDCPETLGVADRADFYDHTGAVLDMIVTHLFQLAAEVAMEPPASFDPEDLQAAREKVIGRFRPIAAEDFVLGQFDGYRAIDGVAAGSRTETYAAMRMFVDTPRWRGVPFLMRTGKRLHASHQTVSLILKDPVGPFGALPPNGNVLRFSLEGNGEIDLSMLTKTPGVGLKLERATAQVPLSSLPDAKPLPPYVRLLHDVLAGDRSLFTRPDGLAQVWKVAQPLLDNRDRSRPVRYRPDSWGPKAARDLAAPDGWLLGQ